MNDHELANLIPVMTGIATLIGVIVAVSRGVSKTETAVAVLSMQHLEIKRSIDALTVKVDTQNGRVGKAEIAIARLESAA